MRLQTSIVYIYIVFLMVNSNVYSQIEVKNDGDVILGNPQTTSPSYTRGLRVYGNIYGPTISGNESSLIGFKNIIGRSGDGILHLQGGVNGGLILMNNSHNGNIILANGGGNVRIGVLNQSNGHNNRLFVNGSIGSTNGFWENLEKLTVKNSKYKNSIDAITLINSLEGIVHTRSKSSNKINTNYGFHITNKLITKMPYAFKGNHNDGYQINYNSLIPLLVEGIKELNNKIDEIESLKKEIENLKETINQVELNSVSISSSKTIQLFQNTPNPYSEVTQIKYYLDKKIKNAKLIIYDLQGTQKHSIDILERGHGKVEITKDNLISGIYLYLISYDNQFSETKKMIMMD